MTIVITLRVQVWVYFSNLNHIVMSIVKTKRSLDILKNRKLAYVKYYFPDEKKITFRKPCMKYQRTVISK